MKKGLLVVITVIAGLLVGVLALARAWSNHARMDSTLDDAFQAAAKDAARVPREFPKGSQWLQSKPLKLADLRGQVVVVHFWTFGCINCIHNYPVYKAWQEKYAGNGVTLIGVHTPEFAREADVDTVRAKAKANGLNFPVVIDNDSLIWKSFGNRYWPSIYLIDKKGRVRYQWEGELDLSNSDGKQFAERIDELRQEKQ
jgi:thiol-disulfide isomerase/thioredoxin